MKLFILMEISWLLLMISAFVNSNVPSTRTLNVNGIGEDDHGLAFCDPQKNSCMNGGKCIQQGDSYNCSCLEGTSGNFCELVEECNDPKFCGDRLLAKCYFNVTKERADCICYDERRTFDPTKKVCKRICGINNNECENGGTCVKNGNSSYCKCLDGTRGDLCEIVNECESNICGYSIKVKCYFDVLKGKAACKCLEEDSVFYEDENRCRKVCSEKNRCGNGGLCVNIGNYSFCSCLDGTSGDLCENVKDCSVYSCGEDIHSSCYFDVENRKASCRCDSKEYIYDNETRICKRPCSEKNCENGGTCEVVEAKAKCFCKPEFSGDTCEIDHSKITCAKRPCMNGGTCWDQSDTFYCDCIEPFVGNFCEKDPCIPSPCANGGTCRFQNSTFHCHCKEPFTGDFCEKVPGDHRYIWITALCLLIFIFIVLVTSFACRRRCMPKE